MRTETLGYRLAKEVRSWRWTWIGVTVAVVLPPLYLWGNNGKSALFAFMAGVGMALGARSGFDGRDD